MGQDDRARERTGVTFDDAWASWADFEAHWGLKIECKVWPPRLLASGTRVPASVALTVERRRSGVLKPLTRHCQVGGARGARTVPAALVRALAELSAVLEGEKAQAEQLAAF